MMNMVRKTSIDKAAAIDLTRCFAASDRQMGISRRSQAMLAAAGMDAPARRWFVITVDNQMDKRVAETLTFAGVEVWVPYVTVKGTRRGGVKRGGRKTYTRLAMPGYVFAKVACTVDSWAGLLSIKGTASILAGAGGQPFIVPEHVILLLQSYLLADPTAAKIVTDTMFEVGERVIVNSGPFCSFPGHLDCLDEDAGRAIVEVMIFGRATPVQLDLAQISKL